VRLRLAQPGEEGGADGAPAAKRGRRSPDPARRDDDAARLAADGALLTEHAAVKCGLASECYEAVDSLIVRLDRDLAQLDSEFLRARLAACEAGEPAAAAAAGAGRKKKGGGAALPPGALAAGAAEAAALLSVRPDLAVDPNEPTYCTCARVSFGDMIACESDSCPVEWFHFECVGASRSRRRRRERRAHARALPAPGLPPGYDPGVTKWYCPSCRGANGGEREAGEEQPPLPSLKVKLGSASHGKKKG